MPHVTIDKNKAKVRIETSLGDRYYLVVPDNGTAEGSYGADSGGSPRPGGVSACRAARNSEACGSPAPQGQVVVSCAAIQAAGDVVRSNPSESVP